MHSAGANSLLKQPKCTRGLNQTRILPNMEGRSSAFGKLT